MRAIDDELLRRLPLPLAELYLRAHNAKTSIERHHNAYFLGEAALKLAAILRIGIVTSSPLDPASPLVRSLQEAPEASVGTWLSFLRDLAQALAARTDRGSVPLAGTEAKMLERRTLPAVKELAELAAKAEAGDPPLLAPELARDAAREGVLGFFRLLAAYRNAVLGHGTILPGAFYEKHGPILLAAVCAVLREPGLFGGFVLCQARLATEDGLPEWLVLRGTASLRCPWDETGSGIDPAPGAAPPEPGRLYFVGAGVRVPLHPLLVHREDRYGRDRVGFLNGAKTRRRRTPAGDEFEEAVRCEYLDYLAGKIAGEGLAEAVTDWLAKLRGLSTMGAGPARPAEAEPEEPAPERLERGAALGDFEIEEEIGRGGMGVVYRARQRSLGRRVALKVMWPHLTADRTSIARFHGEIGALVRCEHPNLVKILASGTRGDRHFYAMELVEGTNLGEVYDVLRAWRAGAGRPLREGHLDPAVAVARERAARRRAAGPGSAVAATAPALAVSAPPGRTTREAESEPPMPPPPPRAAHGDALAYRFAALFADAADALAELHDTRVVHRDLKPANLMITADASRLVLLDLGLAKMLDRSHSLTLPDTPWVGTLRYCAPEQLRANRLEVDHRVDIYGLGAALYEMTVLQPLFAGDTEERLRHQVQEEEPQAPEKAEPAYPRDLSAVVHHCLEKERGHRYDSARALADDLRRFHEGRPVGVRPVNTLEWVWRWCRRKPLAASAIVFVLALVIFSSGFMTLSYRATRHALEREKAAKDEAVRKHAEAQASQERAQKSEEEARRQLVRLGVAAGTRLLEDDERLEALARFIEAGEREPEQPVHAWRVAALAERCPALVAIWTLERPPLLVEFLDGGRRVLTLDEDGAARVRDRESGTEERSWSTGAACVASLSPDGEWLATGARDGMVRLFAAATGREPAPAPENGPDPGGPRRGRVLALVFSPVAPRVLSLHDDRRCEVRGPEGRVGGFDLDAPGFAAALDETGTLAAVALADGRIVIADLAQGKFLPDLESRGARALAFARGGPWLAAGAGRSARVENALSRGDVWPPLHHHGAVVAVAFDASGRTLATGSSDHTAMLWGNDGNPRSDRPLFHRGEVTLVRFAALGTALATLSTDHSARAWESPSGNALTPPLAHPDEIVGAALAPDGRFLATACRDRRIRVWDLVGGVLRPLPPNRDMLVVRAWASADANRLATLGEDSVLRFWDGATFRSLRVARGDPRSFLAFDARGDRFLTVDGTGRGAVVDTASGKELRLLPGAPGIALSLSPDGRTVAVAYPGERVALLEVDSGQESRSWPYPRVATAGFTRDGQGIAAQDREGCLKLWPRAGDPPAASWTDEPMAYQDQSPDGRRVVTVAGARALVWDAAAGRLAATLKHEEEVMTAAFSPDGTKVLTCSRDNTARVWDAATGKPITPPLRHFDELSSGAWHPGGHLVATASLDGRTRLWDAETGEAALYPMSDPTWAHRIRFSPDGSRLYSVSSGGVWVRDLPASGLSFADVAESARARVGPEALLPESADAQARAQAIAAWSADRLRLEGRRRSPPGLVRAWRLWEAARALDHRAWAAALEHARAWAAEGDEGWLGPALIGNARVGLEDWAGGETDLTAAIGRGADEWWVWAWRGVARERLGALDRAREDFGEAVARGTQAAWVFARRGFLCGAAQDWAGAADAYRRATGIDPSDTVAGEEFATVLLVQGDAAGYADACRRTLRTGERANPDRMAAYLWIFSIAPGAIREEDRPELEPLLHLLAEGARRLDLGFWPRVVSGFALHRLGRHAEACSTILAALDAHPQEEKTLSCLFLALACAAQNRLDEARIWLAKAPPPDARAPWPLRAQVGLVRREAEQVMGGH